MQDSFETILEQTQPLFLNGLQAILATISLAFKEQDLPDCDFYDLFYFSCLFLGVLVNRIPQPERNNISQNIPDLLKESAKEGVSFCEEILSANIEGKDDNEKLGLILTKLQCEGIVNNDVILSISKDLENLSMKEGGLWKQRENYPINSKTHKIETYLLLKFDGVIDKVLEDLPDLKLDITPELFFLVISVANIGLIAGYGSSLFKQSTENFMKSGIEKFTHIISQGGENNFLH